MVHCVYPYLKWKLYATLIYCNVTLEWAAKIHTSGGGGIEPATSCSHVRHPPTTPSCHACPCRRILADVLHNSMTAYLGTLLLMFVSCDRSLTRAGCLDVVGSARCKDTTDYFEERSSCFVFYSDEFLTWYDARNRCLKKGGDLATFVNVDSSVGVGKLAKSPHWIGLRSSWWTWLNGRQSSQHNVVSVRIVLFIYGRPM